MSAEPRGGRPAEGRLRRPRAFAHPLWWAALIGLLLNDHVLKGAGLLPALLTGKLSDVLGLIVLPPLLCLAFDARRAWSRPAALALSGGALALVNLWPVAAAQLELLYAALGLSARVVCDAKDLLALPSLLLAAPLCRPAFARTGRRLRPIFERVGVGLAACACLATSLFDSKGDEDDAAPNHGPRLENAGEQALIVMVASTNGAGGCRLYRDDRVGILSEHAFGTRRELIVDSGERVALSTGVGADGEGEGGRCGAAWLVLPDGDERLIFWRDLDEIDSFVPETDRRRLDRRVVVEGEPGAFKWTIGDDLREFALDDAAEGPTCETPQVEHSLGWSALSQPQGFFELDELRSDDEGCLLLDLFEPSSDPTVETLQLCVPEWALPFEPGDLLSVVETPTGDGGRRLRITRLVELEPEVRLTLEVDTADFDPDGPVGGLAAADCFGELDACGAYVRPLVVELRGREQALQAGEEAELDGGEVRVLIGPVRAVGFSAPECDHPLDLVGGSASVLVLER
ncbi:MAG: hypothetical protein OEZ06_06235 [Myxococcales bacterium]|nr:hypothetical protein [Myxococcales bacterium]